jgi:hypothetical protein
MKTLLGSILVLSLCVASEHPASAGAQLRLSDGTPGGTIIITDDGPGDSANTTPGIIAYSGPVGANWNISIAAGVSKPLVGSAASPVLDLSSQAVSAGAGTLTIDFSDTDFTSGGAAVMAVGGTTAGSVTYQAWSDPGITNFGEASLIGTVGPSVSGAFSGVTNGIVRLSPLLSLTAETVIQHSGAGTSGFDANLTVTPPNCNCGVTFTAPASITNCAGDTIPDVTATEDCGAGPTPVTVTVTGAVTNGVCPQIITRTNTAIDDCGNAHTFVQTITVNCSPNCTITSSVSTAVVGGSNYTASVASAGVGATYNWSILNGTITAGQGTSSITWSAGTNPNNPVTIFVTVTTAAGCQSSCSTSVHLTPGPACTIQGVTISNTSWNKFNVPNGTNPVIWVHAHLNGISGIPKTGVTTVQFVGVSLTVNGTSYALPDGVMTFDSSAPATPTTTFIGGKWQTVFNPNNLSDEMFFTGAAIPVTASIASNAKATLTFTSLSSVSGISYSWQWSAAVYTFWPADWNQALIMPYHKADHAGTPENTTVQKSLIQGPRGGGGSNFTGSWSATGTAACQ